jgi:hypothetical protein
MADMTTTDDTPGHAPHLPRVASAVLRRLYAQQSPDHRAHMRAWRLTAVVMALVVTGCVVMLGVVALEVPDPLTKWAAWCAVGGGAATAGLWAFLHGWAQAHDRARADYLREMAHIASHHIAHLLTHAHDDRLSRVCDCTGLRDGFPLPDDGDCDADQR